MTNSFSRYPSKISSIFFKLSDKASSSRVQTYGANSFYLKLPKFWVNLLEHAIQKKGDSLLRSVRHEQTLQLRHSDVQELLNYVQRNPETFYFERPVLKVVTFEVNTEVTIKIVGF
jgi:hypothetical protein